MKVSNINPETWLFLAGGLAVLYITYKSTKAVGNGIDAVTSIPGKVYDSVSSTVSSIGSGISTAVSDAWHSATDIFDGSSVKAGTTTTPRTVDPVNGSFQEAASNSVNLFDPRFYGLQGNTVLPASTNQSGPGGGGLAVGTSDNSSAFFSATNPLGNFSGA